MTLILLRFQVSGKPGAVQVDVTGRCPPEDVGGLPGYEHFLQAIGDQAHPEHEELTEWAGGPFDPNFPDAEERRLDVLKLAKKWKTRKK
jgi:hypothetical protein